MTLSQALQRVSEFYVPGVVKYYAQITPDPWQMAHDDLERIAGNFDPVVVNPATERFVERCRELVRRFADDAAPAKSVSPADGFAMSRRAIDAHMSRKQKKCAVCDSKEGLKIVPVEPGSMDVMLVCQHHARSA